MKTFKIKFTRSYVTYVDVVAEDKYKALEKFDEMMDYGSVYLQEMEQCNVEDEDITIISEKGGES